jgi:hypothetical protein
MNSIAMEQDLEIALSSTIDKPKHTNTHINEIAIRNRQKTSKISI